MRRRHGPLASPGSSWKPQRTTQKRSPGVDIEKTTGAVNRLRSVVDDIGWAARRYNSSRGQIIARLWTIYRHTRCRPFEAHHDGLSNPALALERLAGTIPKSELLALQSRLNPASTPVQKFGDVLAAHAAAASWGLSAVRRKSRARSVRVKRHAKGRATC
jgi:hypothetical protein